jgi:anti-sigma factor RsiW
MSKHFTDERWSDYVRGLAPAREAAAIEQHLEKGCEACHQSLRLWQTVAEIGNSEVRNEVPEDLLQTSQAAYAAWRQMYVLPQRARMARLIFDSLLEPLPPGIRSGSPSSRRILQRAGQWLFDLRFEPAGGRRMFLMGQILRSGRQFGGSVRLPVF